MLFHLSFSLSRAEFAAEVVEMFAENASHAIGGDCVSFLRQTHLEHLEQLIPGKSCLLLWRHEFRNHLFD
jgi:hypothetical protein